MSLFQIILLAVVQGFCELLPVSSSAHVIVVAKLLGLDPTSPEMTLLLVMLHTGTMFAVIVHFWPRWRVEYFASAAIFGRMAREIIVATALTGAIGMCLLLFIEKILLRAQPHAEVEQLFGNLTLIAAALAIVGVLIVIAGSGTEASATIDADRGKAAKGMDAWKSSLIGAVQGLCLPFRGFSRSGATISTALLLGIGRRRAESFSFALAVVLTPPVLARELYRLVKAHALISAADARATIPHWSILAMPGFVGLIASFVAGLLALRWLSAWLEHGRWRYFGFYCIAAALIVFGLGRML